MAATKASGEGGVLSGLAAAYLWGLVKGTAPPPEVTCSMKRRIRGVQTRRRRIDARDKTVRRGIPVTTVPRTLIALSSLLPLPELARAFHAKGAANLRRVLRRDTHVTLSELERSFLRMLRREGLPLPETNRPAGSHRVDCRWPGQRLTVELDSYRYHGSRHAWERDRRREREAYARGDQFRRFTWGDVEQRPAPIVAELRELLTPPGSRAASCSP